MRTDAEGSIFHAANGSGGQGVRGADRAKVRALTRIATSANDARLVEAALAATAAQVERIVRAWRRVDRGAAARHTAATSATLRDDYGQVPGCRAATAIVLIFSTGPTVSRLRASGDGWAIDLLRS